MDTSNDSLLIVDTDGHTEVEKCVGPDELGHCPQVAWGDVVPCAGRALQPRSAKGGEVWRVVVPPGSDVCPLPAVQPHRRRYVWWLAAFVAMLGAGAGAGIATAVTLGVTNRNAASASTLSKIPPAAPAKVAAAAPASSGAAIFTAAQVPVTLSDYKVTLPSTTISAGTKSLQITNAGSTQHELLVFHPDSSIDPTKLPLGADGDVNEDAAGINKISDGDNIDSGKSQTRQVDLSKPGTYVFVCNLPGHYKMGMWTVVTVR